MKYIAPSDSLSQTGTNDEYKKLFGSNNNPTWLITISKEEALTPQDALLDTNIYQEAHIESTNHCPKVWSVPDCLGSPTSM